MAGFYDGDEGIRALRQRAEKCDRELGYGEGNGLRQVAAEVEERLQRARHLYSQRKTREGSAEEHEAGEVLRRWNAWVPR